MCVSVRARASTHAFIPNAKVHPAHTLPTEGSRRRTEGKKNNGTLPPHKTKNGIKLKRKLYKLQMKKKSNQFVYLAQFFDLSSKYPSQNRFKRAFFVWLVFRCEIFSTVFRHFLYM